MPANSSFLDLSRPFEEILGSQPEREPRSYLDLSVPFEQIQAEEEEERLRRQARIAEAQRLGDEQWAQIEPSGPDTTLGALGEAAKRTALGIPATVLGATGDMARGAVRFAEESPEAIQALGQGTLFQPFTDVGAQLARPLAAAAEPLGQSLEETATRTVPPQLIAEAERQAREAAGPSGNLALDVLAQAPQLALAAGASPPVALGVMGASAAGQALEEGVPPAGALARGIVEVGTEASPIGTVARMQKLMQPAAAKAFGATMKALGSQGGQEALEEVAATLGTEITDRATYRGGEPLGPEEIAGIMQDAGYSGLVGFFVGSIGGAGAAAAGQRAGRRAEIPQAEPQAPVEPVLPPQPEVAPSQEVVLDDATKEFIAGEREAPAVEVDPALSEAEANRQAAANERAADRMQLGPDARDQYIAQERRVADRFDQIPPEGDRRVAEPAVPPVEREDAPPLQEPDAVAEEPAVNPQKERVVTGEKAAPSVPEPSVRVGPSPSLQGGEPIGTARVLGELSKAWNVPIRFGRIGRKVAGVFKLKPEVVRLAKAGDLNAAAHEVAHVIDQRNREVLQEAPFEAAAELDALGEQLYGTDASPDTLRTEGFAEYIRHYLTESDAGDVAPNFDAYFQSVLGKHPEISEPMSHSREVITTWREQPSLSRVKGQQDYSGKMAQQPFPERVSTNVRKLYKAWGDRWATVERAIRQAMKLQGRKREDLPAKNDPYLLMAASEGAQSSAARYFALEGPVGMSGEKLGPSLREALKPVAPKDYENFMAYALAKRTIELSERTDKDGNAAPIDTGVLKSDAEQVVSEMENPEWEQALRDLNSYGNALVDYLIQGGTITATEGETIKKSSSFWVPLQRLMQESAGGRELERGGAGAGGEAIRRIRGSQRPIQDILRSLIISTERWIGMADHSRAAREMARIAMNTPRGGEIMEEIPEKMVPRSISIETVKKQLEELGIKVPESASDEMLTVFSNGGFEASDPYLTVVIDGKRRSFHIKDKMLFDALKGTPQSWGRLSDNVVFEIMAAGARGVRLGATGLNPGFAALTNPQRDFLVARIQSKGLHLSASDKQMLKELGVDTAKLFRAGGGKMSSQVGMDIKVFKAIREEIMSKTKWDVVKAESKHPIESLKNILSWSDVILRQKVFTSEYAKTLRETKDPEEAYARARYEAAEVTINFRRAGTQGQVANRIIAFFNPAIQGMISGTRAVKQRPVRTLGWATATLTVPALALWALNKDEEWYQEIPLWEKVLFMHFKTGETIWRVPLPFEWGMLFATIPVAILESFRKSDPKHFAKVSKLVVDALTPPLVPSAVRPAIEVAMNYSLLTERPIVSQRLERLLPEEQYYPSTSEAYKAIGGAIGVSPVKIQHLAEQHTGGLARVVADPLKARSVKEKADIPVLGRAFSRTGREGQSVSDLYEELGDLERAYATIRKAYDSGDTKRMEEIENKFGKRLGLDASDSYPGRGRYPRLFDLRDGVKKIRESRKADDPAIATRIARDLMISKKKDPGE